MTLSQIIISEYFSNKSNLLIPMEIIEDLSNLKFDGEGEIFIAQLISLFLKE